MLSIENIMSPIMSTDSQQNNASMSGGTIIYSLKNTSEKRNDSKITRIIAWVIIKAAVYFYLKSWVFFEYNVKVSECNSNRHVICHKGVDIIEWIAPINTRDINMYEYRKVDCTLLWKKSLSNSRRRYLRRTVGMAPAQNKTQNSVSRHNRCDIQNFKFSWGSE